MFNFVKNQTGGALVGILLVIIVIAAIYFGSSFFLQESDKGTLDFPLDSLQFAQEEVADVNSKIEEQNEIIKDESKEEANEEAAEVEEEGGETTATTSVENKEEVDFNLDNWQEVVRENEHFKIKYHKNWYYTVNRVEAIQNGYNMIIGFSEDPDIWEQLPPFAVELVIAGENVEIEYDGYVRELGVKDGKKYILRTEDNQDVVDAMATTFEFIN